MHGDKTETNKGDDIEELIISINRQLSCNRVSQNAPKCLFASIEVHVAVSIPQEPPQQNS